MTIYTASHGANVEDAPTGYGIRDKVLEIRDKVSGIRHKVSGIRDKVSGIEVRGKV